MNPLTADNNDGRVLLALRAGPMTPSELNERSLNFRGWLIKAGFVEQVGDYYRITEAGRAACPFRNPLAATVAPAKQEFKMTMPKMKRQDVLEAIVAVGDSGIDKTALVNQFGHLVNDFKDLGAAITAHLVTLNRDGLIWSPGRGIYRAVMPEWPAPSEAWEPDETHPANSVSTEPATLLPYMQELQAEQIEIKDISERRGPIKLHDQSRVDFGMFRSGRLEIYHEGKSILVMGEEVVGALQKFLGLFQEAA